MDVEVELVVELVVAGFAAVVEVPVVAALSELTVSDSLFSAGASAACAEMATNEKRSPRQAAEGDRVKGAGMVLLFRAVAGGRNRRSEQHEA